MNSVFSRAAIANAPLRIKLTALMLLTAGAGLLVSTPAFVFNMYGVLKAEADRDLRTTSEAIATNTTAALSFGDTRTAAELLSALRAKPAVVGACLFRVDDQGLAQTFAAFDPRESYDCNDVGLDEDRGRSALTVAVPVILDGDRIGSLRVTQSLASVHQAMREQVALGALVFLISVVICLGIALRVQSTITGPILHLAQVARRISETHDYSLRADGGSRDELGQLTSDFNGMLAQIAKADEELQRSRTALAEEVAQTVQANARLEATLEDLRRMQAQLVQSEKMASLGALVAGIAHEINTPVGVGVTAASTLAARAAQVRAQYEADALKRTDLVRFLTVACESSDILLKNLQRAADLISSFKRVAVDQSSDERRRFDLKTYIGETLRSLAPKYRKLGHSVTVECPEGVEVDSYPGSLAQILTNFVSNSLMHAFEPGQAGHMRIDARLEGDDVVLRYQDDGKGIPAENLARIFDPFFTTKRSAGGSGLGLHIVYNLASQKLGGAVSARSEAGHGVEFLLRFPRIAKSRT